MNAELQTGVDYTRLHYRGRISQIGIYLGKLIRMFVYQSDWKVLPMAALIAGLVTFAVGANLYKTQEGTLQGSFALVCVCIWNGFFNSIQVICRERPIIKREHRAGMHITSYIAAHMIYQMILCILQTAIMLAVCMLMKLELPSDGLVTRWFLSDLFITLFLITYSADMLSLAISALVRNTTTAMTVMPFVLIFQLLFSGGLVVLTGTALKLTDFTIAKWGLKGLCTLGNYNARPMVALWNTIFKFRDLELLGYKPIGMIMDEIQNRDMLDEVLLASGQYNQNAAYVYTAENLTGCWIRLIGIGALFAVISVVLLEFVDRDRR